MNGGALRTEVVSLSAIEAHRLAWADLAARCLEPCIFMEPAFALPAALHLARAPGPSFVLVWGEDARLLGLCVVARTGRLLAHAFIHPQTTSAFPLLDRELAEPALDALLAALAHLPSRPAALLLAGVPLDGPTAQLIATRCTRRVLDERSRAVLRPASSEDANGGKVGKEERRQARRLAERGDVRFTTAPTHAALPQAAARFVALEAQGWKGRAGTAFGSKPDLHAFAQAAVAELANTDAVRIGSLELDGTAIAMGIVLRSRYRAWFWKVTYDETLARLSPGVLFTRELTRHLAAETGLDLVDSCAVADHPMIDRLWPGRMPVGDLLIDLRAGPVWRFRAALGFETARRAVRSAAKRAWTRLRKRHARVPGA